MNSNRALQLLLAALLAAAAVWVARHTYWDTITVDDPPRGEAARNRYYAFEQLAHRLKVRTRQIPTLRTMPAPDGVLFVDDLRGAALRDRSGALERWVAGGGRLLLSRSALLGSPGLRSWTGLGVAAAPSDDEAGASSAPPRRAAGAPAADADCAPYVERLAGRETGKTLRACLGTMPLALSSARTPAWSLSDGYGFQMLRVEIGKGSVAVIGCECLMGNKSLLRQDHARIVFASVPLRAGDAVDILNPVAGEGLLALLWRRSAAAISVALSAVLLVIWRNLPRFGPIAATPPPLRRSLAEQIRASAGFAWRTRRIAALHRAECRALTRSACRIVASYERMDLAQRSVALAARTGLDGGALRDALAETGAGGPEAQRTAITLLEKARRRLNPRISPIQGARA